jgi:hypothetical protein
MQISASGQRIIRAPNRNERARTFSRPGSSSSSSYMLFFFFVDFSRTESPTPICNNRQCAHRFAHRSGSGGSASGSGGSGLLHRFSGAGGRGTTRAMMMTRNRCCTTGGTGMGTAATSTANTTVAAASGAFFIGPTFHALCVCCIVLVFGGVHAVLEFLFYQAVNFFFVS